MPTVLHTGSDSLMLNIYKSEAVMALNIEIPPGMWPFSFISSCPESEGSFHWRSFTFLPYYSVTFWKIKSQHAEMFSQKDYFKVMCT